VTSVVTEVTRTLERRVLTDFMDLLILSIMYNSSSSIGGYDVIRYLHKHFHFLPSPGTVYSNIYALEREGLIEVKTMRRRRTYTLTEKGRKYFQKILSCKSHIEKILNNFVFKNGVNFSQQQ